MKVFIELLHSEIPLKKGVEFVDNWGKQIATDGVPKWANVFSPIFNNKGVYASVGKALVGRIYCDVKSLLKELNKKRLTQSLLESAETTAVFDNALKAVIKK